MKRWMLAISEPLMRWEVETEESWEIHRHASLMYTEAITRVPLSKMGKAREDIAHMGHCPWLHLYTDAYRSIRHHTQRPTPIS